MPGETPEQPAQAPAVESLEPSNKVAVESLEPSNTSEDAQESDPLEKAIQAQGAAASEG